MQVIRIIVIVEDMPSKRSLRVAVSIILYAGCSIASFAQPAGSDSAAGAEGIAIGVPNRSARVGAMKSLADDIRARIRSVTDSGGLLAIIAAATAYGIFHALGPGHQKTLISGYLLSEGGNASRVFSAAGIAAASHALSVVALFGALAVVNGGLSATAGEGARIIVTRLSAIALAALSIRMLWIRIGRARDRFSGDHAPGCTCSLHRAGCMSKKASPLILFAGSLVPCPGAAFFLILGFSTGNPLAGVLAVIAISVGMWITLVAVGFIALGLRSTSVSFGRRGTGRGRDVIASMLEIGGSALVLTFAVALLVT